jgi:hypothetical protein
VLRASARILLGQAFGRTEVYPVAAAFASFGASVAALKSVTLAIFAAFIALNFILLDRLSSRRVAIGASLLLIISPPALVLWSLCASAEYIWIMLLGTLLLLVSAEGHRPGAGRSRLLIGFIADLGCGSVRDLPRAHRHDSGARVRSGDIACSAR